MKKVTFITDINVRRRADMVEAFEEHSVPDYADPAVSEGDKLADLMINPEGVPVECGYEIVNKKATQRKRGYRIEVSAHVLDETLIWNEARKVYTSNWGNASWKPSHIGEALYEILVASNANESPDDMGVEIAAESYPEIVHFTNNDSLLDMDDDEEPAAPGPRI